MFSKYPHTLLFAVNLIFIILAYRGFFEGKDLLPILTAVLTTLLAFLYLLKKNKGQLKIKLLGITAVLLSAIGLYHTHFNVFLVERARISEENSIHMLLNKKAPNLTFTESENYNTAISIDSLISRNEFTILNFWATWCTPCIKEMPLLDEFHKVNKDKPIGLIGFTDYRADDTDELEKIKNLINKLNINYPILIDTSTHVRNKYKAGILPATVLIDGEGKVVDYQVGIKGAEQIMTFIIDQLKEREK